MCDVADHAGGGRVTPAVDGTVVSGTVLAILGPTAAGKTAAALSLARERAAGGRAPVEVVAVDAFTVYRGMDVGTAKATPAERAEVEHHMVDVRDPTDDVDVAWFQQAARAAVDDVLARGATPLLVGGSGLYWRAVVDDLRFPPTDAGVRATIELRWRDRPLDAHAHLATLDPLAAARIEPANLRRTVRALEVVHLTGRPFSSFRRAWDDHTGRYADLRAVLLSPEPAVLRRRIAARAARMVAGGLLEEADRLRGLALSGTARQAIGYAEAIDALEAADRGRPVDTEELAGAIARRTFAYARRQRTWFRRDPRLREVEPSAVGSVLGT